MLLLFNRILERIFPKMTANRTVEKMEKIKAEKQKELDFLLTIEQKLLEKTNHPAKTHSVG